MAQLAVRLQQRFAFLRHREICDHRCEMDVGQGYLATAEIFGVGNKPFQRGEHAGRGVQAPFQLGDVERVSKARPKEAMGKHLSHQRPVGIAVDNGDKLAAAGATVRLGGLQTGTRECLVDVTRDRTGLLDLKAVVNECGYALEGVKREVAFRNIGSERIDLGPMVFDALLCEREPRDPAVNAVSVTV